MAQNNVIVIHYQDLIIQKYQNRLHNYYIKNKNIQKQLFDFQSEYDLFTNKQTAQ